MRPEQETALRIRFSRLRTGVDGAQPASASLLLDGLEAVAAHLDAVLRRQATADRGDLTRARTAKRATFAPRQREREDSGDFYVDSEGLSPPVPGERSSLEEAGLSPEGLSLELAPEDGRGALGPAPARDVFGAGCELERDAAGGVARTQSTQSAGPATNGVRFSGVSNYTDSHVQRRYGLNFQIPDFSKTATKSSTTDIDDIFGTQHVWTVAGVVSKPFVKNALTRRLSTRKSWLLHFRSFLRSKFFEFTMLAFIMINSSIVGIQLQDAMGYVETGADKYVTPDLFKALELTFTIIFSIEWVLRVADGRLSFFCGPGRGWSWFDTLVLLAMWLEFGYSGSELASTSANSRILRSLKVVRAIRALTLLRFLSGLRMLIATVIIAIKSTLWTSLVVVLLLYMFGIAFAQGTFDYCQRSSICTDGGALLLLHRFGSVPRSLLSLFQAMTNGLSWDELFLVLDPLPVMYKGLLLLFVSTAHFAILNVVTGIFVETTLHVAKLDKADIVREEIVSKEIYLKKVNEIFVELDVDKTEEVTFEQFKAACKDRELIAYFNAVGIDFSDVLTLFTLLDRNQDGSINRNEFLRGCMRLQGEAKRLEIAKLTYETEWLMHNMSSLIEVVDGIAHTVGASGHRRSSRRHSRKKSPE